MTYLEHNTFSSVMHAMKVGRLPKPCCWQFLRPFLFRELLPPETVCSNSQGTHPARTHPTSTSSLCQVSCRQTLLHLPIDC